MACTLFFSHYCPPSRGVYLVAKALALPLNIKEVDILSHSYLNGELPKINPQHTVPTLKDGDFTLWDSHAIAGYLCDSYGKHNDLYPSEAKKRAKINNCLHFDSRILYPKLKDICKPLLFNKRTFIPNVLKKEVYTAYEFLEEVLRESEWLAGDRLTIADHCCVSTLSSLDYVIPIHENIYPKLFMYMQRMSKLPYYEEANQLGVDLLGQKIQECLLRNLHRLEENQ